MIEIAICEDNTIDSSILEHFVINYLNGKHLEFHIESFSNGEELLTAFEKGKYQLIFLDIFMDCMTGIDVGKAIRSIDYQTEFIFCTSSSQYALESYDILALGYLLKPFDPVRMKLLLDRFIQRFTHLSFQTLTVKYQYEDYTMRLDHIIFVKSDDKVLLFHLITGDVVRSYGKLNKLENDLHFPNFLRCHQRYIINMDYILTVNEDYFTVEREFHIPIRKHEIHKIKDAYRHYEGNMQRITS